MTMERPLFSLFIGMLAFFLWPLGALILCREQLRAEGRIYRRLWVFVGLALGAGVLLCAVCTVPAVRGLPYALEGRWTQASGVFQEWTASRKPDAQRAILLVEGQARMYSIRNLRRGELQSGDEVRFWVKPEGDRDIYIAAWRRPPESGWRQAAESLDDLPQRQRTLRQGLLVLTGGLLALLGALCRKIRAWREPRRYLAFTALWALGLAAAGGGLWQAAGQAGSGQEVRAALGLFLGACYGALLWALYAYGRAIFRYNRSFWERSRDQSRE